MPSVNGLGTTFNLPNYAGELLLVTPTDTPFLSAIGGLSSGGEVVTSTIHGWQTEDLAAAAQPAILEGANPSTSEQARANVANVCQIFQYGVSVSYTKLAATGQLAINGTGQTNPVQDELSHQVMLKLATAARDINYSMLRGAYALPVDNTTARKMRGLNAAIATNVTANGAPAALTETMVLDLLQSVWSARGINPSAEPTIVVNAKQKRALSTIFVTNKNYQEQTRTVGGVNVQAIETDFGRINIMLERSQDPTALTFAQLGQCKPVFLLIPGKGFLFVEELAKTGAAVNYQLYGEIGLQYGDEAAHGKITNLS